MSIRNKAKILGLVLILLIFSWCFIGCFNNGNDTDNNNDQEAEDVKYEYSQEYVNIFKTGGYSSLIMGNLEVTYSEHNKYYFDRGISEDLRANYIKMQNLIFDVLNKNGVDTRELNIYVLSNVENQAVKADNSMYINISDLGTVNQVNLTLQLVFGEYTKYGYIYSLSNHIAAELNWETDDEIHLDESIIVDNKELLSLVYPCFSEKYYEQREIEACKSLSNIILKNMSNLFGGEEEFQCSLDNYVAEKDFDYKKTYLEFASIDEEWPIKIRTKYLEIYLRSDYRGSCTHTEKSIKEDPMFNFDKIIEFWEYADNDIAEVRAIFDFDSNNIVPVYVQEINKQFSSGGDVAGLFVPTSKPVKILLEDVYTITHEYTHYIDYCVDSNTKDDIEWCAEALACYYGKNMSYIERTVAANSGLENVLTIEELSNLLGNPYDSADDEIMFMSIMNAYEENPKYVLRSTYNARLSFGHYFVETYGQEAFITCMLSPEMTYIVVGQNLDAVMNDWCEWLEQWKIYG